MKRFISPCLALASVTIVCASAGASRPQYGGTLRVEVEAALRTIDPAAPSADAAEAAIRARASRLAFETLTAIDLDGLQPLLATSWETEGRGLRWRFHLRSGVRLHDGSPLEAWQVAASLRASGSSWKAAAEGDTIAIDTDTPLADLPWVLAEQRHAIVIRGSGGTLAGTGPFRIERLEGARASFRAHDAYWRARPFVDAVQIDTGRPVASQVGDLEAGRTDVVGVRPTDAPRLARRGLRIEASRPLELVALVFEPHRATDAALTWRRTFASAFDRDAMCAVLLQGYGVPARTVMPAWLSGYAPLVAVADRPVLSRSAVAALPVDDRDVTIRVDAGDALSQAIAERIAADAREAGFSVKVQTPVGLAPRPDARLVRIAFVPTTPDRAFAHASGLLVARGWPAIGPPENATLTAVHHAEQSLLDRLVVVPVVHVPELVGLGDRVGFSTVPGVRPVGGWNLPDVWLQGGKP
jgi:peptide/nickel transport system substrate-binding protein